MVHEKKRVVIDFRETERCTAAAVLCLYATVQNIQKDLSDRNIIRCTLSKSNNVNSAIRFSGLYALVNGRELESMPFGYMPIVTGTSVKGHLRSIIHDMCNDFYGGDMSEDGRFALYEAISEAMLNVMNHAYMDGFEKNEFVKDRWWVIAARDDEQLYLAIYDKGVGIPVSLPKNFDEKFIASLKSLIGGRSDGEMIQAAMEIGRTRTDHKGRGKGLQDVKGFVDINPNGKLWVFSNNGKYLYDNLNKREEVSNIDISVGGTLIQWNVSIEDFANNGAR